MTNYKKSKIKYGILFCLHNILLYVILGGFLLASFIAANRDTKIVMTIGMMSEIVIVAIAMFTHRNLKSVIWILITIIYAGLTDSLLVPLIIISIYTLLDEVIFEFFYKKYQKEYRDLRTLNKHDEDKANEKQGVREQN